MMFQKEKIPTFFKLLLIALFLPGCAGTVKNMQSVSPEQIVTAPEEGKSMVVFMRPSTLGFAIQSSVFEIQEDSPALVGIVAAKTKVAYQLEPGEHLFMVVGESADFMSAELEVNKTYYVLVTPRMGALKARFSLEPIHAAQLGSSQVDEWIEACDWVEKTAASENWANDNMFSIQEKQKKYWETWISKDISKRPKLLPQDGR
jgi:hypothetical protein